MGVHKKTSCFCRVNEAGYSSYVDRVGTRPGYFTSTVIKVVAAVEMDPATGSKFILHYNNMNSVSQFFFSVEGFH